MNKNAVPLTRIGVVVGLLGAMFVASATAQKTGSPPSNNRTRGSKVGTSLKINPANTLCGKKVRLYAYLTRNDNKAGVEGATITFKVGKDVVGTDKTKSSVGVASIEYYVGNKTVGAPSTTAQFDGDAYFSSSQKSSTLTIRQGYCGFNVEITPQPAKLNKPTKLYAKLINQSSLGIKDKPVKLEIDNKKVSTLNTNDAGEVTYSQTFTSPGTHLVKFSYDGDTYFHPCDPLKLTFQVK